MKPPIYHRMFDYDTNLLPNRHLASLEHDVSTIDAARKKTGASIGYPGWGLIYHLLLSHLDRNNEQLIIETGTNFGATTIILAQSLIDAAAPGKVVTVELSRKNTKIARENFRAAGVSDFIDTYCGDSKIILPKLAREFSSVRFAFLDASHLCEDVLFEFETLQPSLTDDALVLFDNTYPIADEDEDQRVYGALKEIRHRFGGNFINLDHVSWYTPGLALWKA